MAEIVYPEIVKYLGSPDKIVNLTRFRKIDKSSLKHEESTVVMEEAERVLAAVSQGQPVSEQLFDGNEYFTFTSLGGYTSPTEVVGHVVATSLDLVSRFERKAMSSKPRVEE